MPENAWRKSKIGFILPIVNWMQNDLRSWFIDIVNSKEFENSDLIDDPIKLKLDIINIANKKNSNFSLAEKY